MGGNGTIGGGKSCEINFKVWDGGKNDKQKWTGTDPEVATKASPCTIKITFHKPPKSVGKDTFEVELVQGDGKVVEIDW